MTLTKELSLKDFEPWGGAKNTVEELREDELLYLDLVLEEETFTETQLNDFLWFETDTIASLLGFADWDDLLARH